MEKLYRPNLAGSVRDLLAMSKTAQCLRSSAKFTAAILPRPGVPSTSVLDLPCFALLVLLKLGGASSKITRHLSFGTETCQNRPCIFAMLQFGRFLQKSSCNYCRAPQPTWSAARRQQIAEARRCVEWTASMDPPTQLQLLPPEPQGRFKGAKILHTCRCCT